MDFRFASYIPIVMFYRVEAQSPVFAIPHEISLALG